MSVAKKNALTIPQKVALDRVSKAAESYKNASINLEAELYKQLRTRLEASKADLRSALIAAKIATYEDGRETTNSEIMRAYGTKDWRTIDNLIKGWEEFKPTVQVQFERVQDGVVIHFFEFALQDGNKLTVNDPNGYVWSIVDGHIQERDVPESQVYIRFMIDNYRDFYSAWYPFAETVDQWLISN